MVRYRRIAQIAKVKGLNGEVVVVPTNDLPFNAVHEALLCAEGVRAHIVPPDYNLIRETRVLRATKRTDGLLLALDGVTDRTTAQRLKGRYLLAEVGEGDAADGDLCQEIRPPDTRRSNTHSSVSPNPLPKPVPVVPSPAVGLKVEDETVGCVGTIIEERLGAAQTLWVVQGPFGEVLIPAVEPFIVSWDAHTVRTNLPVGLLELNA